MFIDQFVKVSKTAAALFGMSLYHMSLWWTANESNTMHRWIKEAAHIRNEKRQVYELRWGVLPTPHIYDYLLSTIATPDKVVPTKAAAVAKT